MIVVSPQVRDPRAARGQPRLRAGSWRCSALAASSVRERPRLQAALFAIGAFGASLFYGDAVLTPAISVLSAIEGLEVGTAAFKPYVVPIAAGILVALFMIQRHGTRVVGPAVRPGVRALVRFARCGGRLEHRQAAGDPRCAQSQRTPPAFRHRPWFRLVRRAGLGAAAPHRCRGALRDMGHFGKRAVRVAWFGLVAPALVLNYFGQGALLIDNPKALENPFYLSYPVMGALPDDRARPPPRP
jgi:KUP system potassium uptake protein